MAPRRKASIVTVRIGAETDVVAARQRARQLAAELGFDSLDQTRIATAVSEIARNAYQYGGGGLVEYAIGSGEPPALLIRISDRGPGLPPRAARSGSTRRSSEGMGVGMSGSRLLMDRFDVTTSSGGTTVEMAKLLPSGAPEITAQMLDRLSRALAGASPTNAEEEARQQNQELIRALEDLRERQAEVEELNAELAETNRGVMALYGELEEKAEHLRRINEQKSRFFSNMSHEFRTPLNAILSLSRLLLDRIDGELTMEQEKQVTFIRRSAEGLSDLVNDLLDMAKAEAGKITLRPADFTIDSLFGTVRGMLRPIISHGRVELIFDEPVGLPALHTDEGKLSQILRNFISNALKFTEEGSVRVSAAPGPADTIIFSVSDTGIGIDSSHLERIFEEFAQVEGAMQNRFRGTGLGLPLSKKLAELLGGTVSVQSEPGRGSRFSVRIPRLYSGPAAVAYVPEIGWQIDPTRTPVLIVESDSDSLFTYETMLRGSGFQAIAAHSLVEAQRALRDVHPAAAVVDTPSPGESLEALIALVKGDDRYRATPLILVGGADGQSRTRTEVDVVLDRPVDRTTLLEVLNRTTRRSRHETVLSVDDDPVARYLLKRLLSDTRFDFVEASGGREGLLMARSHRPDVILLDLAMPDMPGFDFLEELRADPELRDIPVIVVTGMPLAEDEEADLRQRVSGLLAKQALVKDALVSAVRDVLEAKAEGQTHSFGVEASRV